MIGIVGALLTVNGFFLLVEIPELCDERRGGGSL
jgi:hypothetical protein